MKHPDFITFSGSKELRDMALLLTNISHTTHNTHVEAGSNTSAVTLRVVRGDEMGLKKAAP
jgi:hypothetical protein